MSEQVDALADLVQKINAAVAGVEAAGKALHAAQEAASALVADGSTDGRTDSSGGEESTDGATDGGTDAGSGGGSQAPGGGGSVDPYALRFNQYGPPLDGSYFNLVIRPERGSDCDPWGNPDLWWQGIAQQVADAGMTDRGDARIAVVLPPDFPAEATAPYMPHVMGELWLMGDFTDAPRPHLKRGTLSFGRSRVAGIARLDFEGVGATWRAVPGIGLYVTEKIFVGESRFTDFRGDALHTGFWGRDGARSMFEPGIAQYTEVMDCEFENIGSGGQKHVYLYNVGPTGQRRTGGEMRIIRNHFRAPNDSHAFKGLTENLEVAYCTFANFDPAYPGVFGNQLIDVAACGWSHIHHNRATISFFGNGKPGGFVAWRARRDYDAQYIPFEVGSAEYQDNSSWQAIRAKGPIDPSHPDALIHRIEHNDVVVIGADTRPGGGYVGVFSNSGTFSRTNALHDPKSDMSFYHDWAPEGTQIAPRGQQPPSWVELSMILVGPGNTVRGIPPGKLFDLGFNEDAAVYDDITDVSKVRRVESPDWIPPRPAFFENGAAIEVVDLDGVRHLVSDVATATANARS